MTLVLASVRSSTEAQQALQAPIGILDLKDPDAGALGALSLQKLREISAVVQGHRPISATAGDLPPDAAILTKRALEIADCGVNYIKLGLFGPEYIETCLGALSQHTNKLALVAVLFVDRFEHFEGPCHALARAGFTGVMLDTADKNSGSLRELVDDDTLKSFVETAHSLSLLCGLAGSLKKTDLAPLVKLNPDYLGFRTALCEDGRRNRPLSLSALSELTELCEQSHADKGELREVG